MTPIVLRPLLAALALLLFLPQPISAQENLSIGSFVGTFSGSGIAEGSDPIYAPETARDMDVVIRVAGDGFEVTWTTVVRDPNGKATRKTETLGFDRAGPNRFTAPSRRDAMTAGGLAWAGIEAQTLNVYILTIDDNGGYQLQRYARTLSGRGMELTFTRTASGDARRSVKGLLVKTAK
ncbi:MAG: hypothetical protein HQ481_06525 [Alphaproteobacteria bacterium]|nr:hypothetical protein [Alphaproteobacteria bacterium]